MTMTVEPYLQGLGQRSEVGENYTIATLGSHSALQILKGARDEGFGTLAIANRETERLYRSFAFVDEVITIDKPVDMNVIVGKLPPGTMNTSISGRSARTRASSARSCPSVG